MSQHVEKEFKNLLTREEYEQLIIELQLTEMEPIHQSNVYYDTADGQLRALEMGLRIRLFEDSGEQTLKSPLEMHANLETTDPLTFKEANELIDTGKLKEDGHVAAQLVSAGIDLNQLLQVGQLSTIRYEFPGDGGIYFLDKSYYQDQKDYELEFEADDLEAGIEIFEKMLHKFKIKRRETPQKIVRAMQYPNS